MKKTVFDPDARAALLERLSRITPERTALWGRMNAEQMLAHLGEALKLGTGDLQLPSLNLIWRYPPLRHLIVHWLPWPKGAPTVPELKRQASDAGTLATSRAEIDRLIAKIAARADQSEWPEHPAFGKIGRRGWGALTWRHVDHHLRQFGV